MATTDSPANRTATPASSAQAHPPIAPFLLGIAGGALVLAAVVLGFLPVTSYGQSCGSPFVAEPSLAGQLCVDARGGRWPWIIVLGILGVAALIAASVLRAAPISAADSGPAPTGDHGVIPSRGARTFWIAIGVLVVVLVVAAVVVELGQ